MDDTTLLSNRIVKITSCICNVPNFVYCFIKVLALTTGHLYHRAILLHGMIHFSVYPYMQQSDVENGSY